MLINKDGKILANSSQLIEVFDTEQDYNAWIDSMDANNLDKFVVIQNYLYNKGSYVETQSLLALENLPDYNKRSGIIYGAIDNNGLYRYDETDKRFIQIV